MNLVKFYRVKDWIYKNMGIAIIGLLTTGFKPDPIWLIPLLQIFFVQLHSFSMNDYFDYKITREKNYIGSKLKSKFSEKKVIFLTALPILAILASFNLLKFPSAYLLAAYVILFFLYQSPWYRLKNSCIASILINSICMGSIFYLYPFLYFSKLTPLSIAFSLIFFFYRAFYELVHQIAHIKRDNIKSLPVVYGIPAAKKIACTLITIPTIIAIVSIVSNFQGSGVFIITILFSLLKLYNASKIQPTITGFTNFRKGSDTILMAIEGAFYIVVLALS